MKQKLKSGNCDPTLGDFIRKEQDNEDYNPTKELAEADSKVIDNKYPKMEWEDSLSFVLDAWLRHRVEIKEREVF